MGDWGVTPVTVGLLAAGIALTPVWARGRLRRDDPIVDLASLRRRTTAATHLTAVAAGFTGFMCFVVTSHALQADEPHGFGLSLTEAGVFMTPASMSFLLIGPVTSQLILRLGMRRTLMIGGTITAAGAIGIALDGTSLPALFVFSFVVFIGNGTLMSSLPVATAAYSDPQDIGSTNGVNALARTTGIAFASGVFALVVGSLATDAVAGVLAWTEGLSAVVAASIVGMCAITIPRRPRRDDASGSGSR
ncbi:MAG: MFS transporter [Aeromicrobium sp.]